jgi:SMI1 / KNR4 family (SUKH-1)
MPVPDALDPELAPLLHEFHFRPACDPAVVEQVRNRFGYAIPDDYFAFIKVSNGGEGPVGERGYVQLWPVDDLEKESRDYDPERAAPHLLMFGSNLGGTVYAFDTQATDKRILAVPLPVEAEYAEFRGRSLKQFLDAEGSLHSPD